MDKLAAALEHRSRRAAAAERARAAATRCRRASSITGSLPVAEVIQRCAAMPEPEPEELPRDAIRLPGGAGNTTRGEGVRRGVGFAVGFKNIGYSEGFDDFCAARVRLFARRLGGGALRSGGGRPGRDERDPPGRVHASSARIACSSRRLDGARRLVGLGVGVADDVDGGGRRARRVPRGTRGARARRAAARSTSSASTAIRRRRRSIPRPGRSRAGRRTSRSRARR